ncbi:MAG: ATP-binding protein [Candidatus Bathyarchaeota archaeon]|nr:ATP-binding protein [Candidatus Bathyarchaeota archaeon]
MMKIRTKSLLTIGLLTLLVFVGFHAFSVYMRLPSYEKVDQREIEKNLAQVINAFGYQKENLAVALVDYSSWDETYRFALGSNPLYVDENFGEGTFQNLKLHFIAIIDNDRKIMYCQFYDLDESQKVDAPDELIQLLETDAVFSPPTVDASVVTGFATLNNEPFIIASAPILTSQNQGPIVGRMIFGESLSDQIGRLEKILNFHASIVSLTDFEADNNEIAQRLLSDPTQRVVKNNDDLILSGYVLVNDIHSNPLLVLQVTNERVAFQEAKSQSFLFLGGSIVLAVILGIGLSILIETSVIRPIKRLASAVKSTSLNAKQPQQFSKVGSDELNLVYSAVHETLDKKFEAMKEVSVMVAHDLRNPLAGIKNAVYVIGKRNTNLDAESKAMLKTINECVDYSDKIVSDLLDFSTEIKLEKKRYPLKELVDTSLRQFSPPGNIAVANMTGPEVEVLVDHEKIIRVFSNLVKNAFDAMPDGGMLSISSRKARKQVVVEFADSGVGMSKQTLEKLWTPFFTTKAKGMGVGLPICKKIVEAHGGRIEVESALGKGTIFRVFLASD